MDPVEEFIGMDPSVRHIKIFEDAKDRPEEEGSLLRTAHTLYGEGFPFTATDIWETDDGIGPRVLSPVLDGNGPANVIAGDGEGLGSVIEEGTAPSWSIGMLGNSLNIIEDAHTFLEQSIEMGCGSLDQFSEFSTSPFGDTLLDRIDGTLDDISSSAQPSSTPSSLSGGSTSSDRGRSMEHIFFDADVLMDHLQMDLPFSQPDLSSQTQERPITEKSSHKKRDIEREERRGKKRSRRSSKKDSQTNQPQRCGNCGTTETPVFRRDPVTKCLLCNKCALYRRRTGRPRPPLKRKSMYQKQEDGESPKTGGDIVPLPEH